MRGHKAHLAGPQPPDRPQAIPEPIGLQPAALVTGRNHQCERQAADMGGFRQIVQRVGAAREGTLWRARDRLGGRRGSRLVHPVKLAARRGRARASRPRHRLPGWGAHRIQRQVPGDRQHRTDVSCMTSSAVRGGRSPVTASATANTWTRIMWCSASRARISPPATCASNRLWRHHSFVGSTLYNGQAEHCVGQGQPLRPPTFRGERCRARHQAI